MTVKLPDNNHEERKYATSVLLESFLGLSISINFSNKLNAVEIALENGHRLLFEDHFFNKHQIPLSYLNLDFIPSNVSFTSLQENPFLPEQDLPIIFGRPKLEIGEEKIICGIDIFASSFFLLTRWEEYVIPERDVHGRFPAIASLSYKQGFLHRPVVNEYLEMLWAMLQHLGIQYNRRMRNFEMMVTHDVDYPLLWNSPFDLLRKTGGSLLKRQNPGQAWYYFTNYWRSFNGKAPDPNDTFDFLMTCAEARHLSAHFFFLSGGRHRLDNPHSFPKSFTRDLMQKIVGRGHHIGFHPSYETIENPDLFRKELQTLEEMSSQPVRSGRQHFLRFSTPSTWQIWEDNGLEWDSTLYYAEKPGFRCGTCWPFPVFNFLSRKPLQLKEIPLSAMEVSWISYLQSTPEQMTDHILSMANVIKKYRGTMVVLWHNSMFLPEFSPFHAVYEKIIDP